MVCREVQKGRPEQGISGYDAVAAGMPCAWLSSSAPSPWDTKERGA